MATPSAKILEELSELHSEFDEFRSQFTETISEITDKQLEITSILEEIKAENTQIASLMLMLTEIQGQITKLSEVGVSPLTVETSDYKAKTPRKSSAAAGGGGGGGATASKDIKRGNITVTIYDNTVTFTGNGTYDRRELIKKHGGSWNKDLNSWICPTDKSDPLIADLKRYCKEVSIEKIAETIDLPESSERPTKGLKKTTESSGPLELGIRF